MSRTPEDETMASSDTISGSTLRASSRFRESTHVIPSPGAQGKTPKPYSPLILRLAAAVGIPLQMVIIGVALEVVIFISNHNNGFKVPVNNVFNVFGNVSAQFLASFFPTLLIIPVAYAWREVDWNIRWYQPYIVLNRGNAPAEESLLLDYIYLGPLLALFRAINYKHRMVFWSSLTAILTYGFQPLTGSIFQIRQSVQDISWDVTSTRTIDLATDGISDLNSFMAAAGYTDASAVLDTIGDPPFVQQGWATAEVAFISNPFSNGTITVQTSGILTNANCSNPAQTSSSVSGTIITIDSTSVNGCTASTTVDSSVSTSQYGVVQAPCPGNSTAPEDLQFLPVAFWFYNQNSSTPQSQTVFCTPLIQPMEVEAIASLNNGSLETVTPIGPYKQNTNLNFSSPFNGVLFQNNPNPFIQARATAIQSILPGAIFKAASRSPGGLQGTFELANGFLELTSEFYTRHLTVTAQLVYFIDQNTTLTATVSNLIPRLVVDNFPAHILAILLIITGLIGLPITVRHRGQRKRLLLATPPGSIASIVALTSRSGFGELLLPYDDELALEKKLDGLRFRLDRRTGAIVADDIYQGDEVGGGMGPDDAMMSLMGGKLDPPDSAATESSSFLAYQTAAGTLPFERSWGPSREPPLKSPLSNTEYVP